MKILSLNIWGAPYAKHRAARVEKIAEKILALSPDVLCFQEVYMPDNRADLIARLKEEYPYYHYFAAALIGSGLLTMSRYPIRDVAFHRFRLGGKPEDIKRGDYYAGKGIGLTRIALPDNLVDVYNIHPHAQYAMDNDNEYAVYNESNLFEAVRFVNHHSGENPLVFCGDFNTRPDQAGYRILMALGNFVDAHYRLNGEHPISFSADNPYVNELNQSLDYIFLRGLGAARVELAMTEHFSSEIKAYSDHYGLLAELNFDVLEPFGERDVLSVIEDLQQRIKIARIETEGQQFGHLEKLALGIGSIIDGALTAAFIGRWHKSLGTSLRNLVWSGAIIYAFYQILQAGINLQPRKQTLEALEQELRLMRETIGELQN